MPRGARVHRRGLRWLLLAAGLLAGPAAHAAEAVAGSIVRDLHFGEVLFHFYQQDDFTALNHLLVARSAGRLPHHADEAELLLGGLYLSYGQHERAEAIFEQLLAGTADVSVHDRAWFYLGKLRYQRGLHVEALAAFGHVGGHLQEALAAELPMLMAQCHMALGDYDAAKRLLEDWDAPGSWLAYARYNLGVALAALGRTGEAQALLERVGSMAASGEEQKGLRDKANLALGYALLQAGDAARARAVLERVRLHGPFANKALLGVGWARALVEDHDGALLPWLELMQRDLLDSAVQESFLAVPYALGRLGIYGSAVEAYQQALGTFDAELAHLDEAIGRARQGKLLPALLEKDEAGLSRWYWRLDAIPDREDSRYLYLLMAGHAFQEGVKNYRDLLALEHYLEDWQQRLAAYAGMVETRGEALATRLPATRERLAGIDIAALRQRRTRLAERLARAEAENDPAALATAEEQDRWQRLAAVAADPRFADAEPALREQHRLLRGLMVWDLERSFRERAWRVRRALGDLDRGIERAGRQLEGVREAGLGEPERLAGFAGRIDLLSARLARMQEAVAASLRRQEGVLTAMAEHELGAQKERLASYRVQAQFALATLYDRAGALQAAATPPPGAAP